MNFPAASEHTRLSQHGHSQQSMTNSTAVLEDPSLTSPQQLFRQQYFAHLDRAPHSKGMAASPSPSMPNVSAVPISMAAGEQSASRGMFSPQGGRNPYSSYLGADSSNMTTMMSPPKNATGGEGGPPPPPPPPEMKDYAPRRQTQAQDHQRLMDLDPRQFTPNDINELLKVIEVSNQYGKDIERSVEELASLLQKKTIECEGLRRLAAENHSSLAEAVKNEYNSRIRVETRQANEIRDLQNKIATMRSEKDDLQREVETLRMMVEQLKSTPASLSDREVHANSLFNRLARGMDDASQKQHVASLLTTWDLPRPAQLTPKQRELVNFVGNLSADVARNLQSAGAFDFLMVLCQRLCTPVNPNGDVYPDIGVALGELLREFRLDIESGAVGASQAVGRDVQNRPGGAGSPERLTIAQQAASATIPLVKKSARMRVIDLYLANNPQDYTKPNKVSELNEMLETHAGKEEALYEKLMALYMKKDPTGAFLKRLPPSNYVYQPPQESSARAATHPSFVDSAGDSISTASPEELKKRVDFMFLKHNPAKLGTSEYEALRLKYPPETLLRALIKKYGPEPTAAEKKELVKAHFEDQYTDASSPKLAKR